MTFDEVCKLPHPAVVCGPSRPDRAKLRFATFLGDDAANVPVVDLYLWDGTELIDPYREGALIDDRDGPFTLVSGPVPPPINETRIAYYESGGVAHMNAGDGYRDGWTACRETMGAPE